MSERRTSILFVDDSKVRFEVLEPWLNGVDIVHVRTSEAAKAAMFDKPYDAIFLDHDLGDEQPNPTEDGTAIAKWLAETAPDDFKENVLVVIHTWNTLAGRRMHAILDDAGVKNIFLMPFEPGYVAGVINGIKERRGE